MSPFHVILTILLAEVLYTSAGYYNCENGVYDTLYHLTEECRQASYTPYLRDLRKKQKHVSGKDVADMLQRYCSVAKDVTSCVEGYINDLPCLKKEMGSFQIFNRRSNWYCDEYNVRDVVKNIYNNLSMENLNYRANQCYKEAPLIAYPCIRRYLNVSHPPTDRRETMKKIMLSFRCTYRKLLRKCTRSTALLMTTLEYDWMIIPPALGINVSDALITVANLKVSRRRSRRSLQRTLSILAYSAAHAS